MAADGEERATGVKISVSAETLEQKRSANAEHTVREECAVSGHRRERRPQDEREIGILAAANNLDESELLLASDR